MSRMSNELRQLMLCGSVEMSTEWGTRVPIGVPMWAHVLHADVAYLAVVITQGSTAIRASNKALTSVQLRLDLS